MALANEYGKALFLLTEEEGCSDIVRSELEIVSGALEQNPEYCKLLDSPNAKKAERCALIDEAFGSLNENLKNLLKILVEGRLMHAFFSVCDEYFALYDDSRGILRAVAVTAVPLSKEQTERLEKKLSDKTGKTVLLSNEVDKNILGGVKLRYSGIQLDGSVKTRLDKFESALLESVIQ